ncbi:MAG: hypothetical protein ACJ71R_08535, partial [Nitrososphaeraceae archaeon]
MALAIVYKVGGGIEQMTTTTTSTAAIAKTTAMSAAAKQQPPQHHPPIATNNNNPASVSNSAAIQQQRVAPVSNLSNKSLLSHTSTIALHVKAAPQENAINQQQQSQRLVRVSNGTAGQNSMLELPPPPVVASDKLMYLGYHDDSTDNNLI